MLRMLKQFQLKVKVKVKVKIVILKRKKRKKIKNGLILYGNILHVFTRFYTFLHVYTRFYTFIHRATLVPRDRSLSTASNKNTTTCAKRGALCAQYRPRHF